MLVYWHTVHQRTLPARSSPHYLWCLAYSRERTGCTHKSSPRRVEQTLHACEIGRWGSRTLMALFWIEPIRIYSHGVSRGYPGLRYGFTGVASGPAPNTVTTGSPFDSCRYLALAASPGDIARSYVNLITMSLGRLARKPSAQRMLTADHLGK